MEYDVKVINEDVRGEHARYETWGCSGGDGAQWGVWGGRGRWGRCRDFVGWDSVRMGHNNPVLVSGMVELCLSSKRWPATRLYA